MNQFAKEVGYSCKAQVVQFRVVPEFLVIITDCRMHQNYSARRGSAPGDQVSPIFRVGRLCLKVLYYRKGQMWISIDRAYE